MVKTPVLENTGHLGGVAGDDIQSISMTLPKFPVYFGDVILSIPAQMSGFGFQGTVHTFLGDGKMCSKQKEVSFFLKDFKNLTYYSILYYDFYNGFIYLKINFKIPEIFGHFFQCAVVVAPCSAEPKVAPKML